MKLDQQFWNDKYLTNNIGWDAKSITRPIKEFVDSLSDKNISILIPGAGRAHEAVYLWKNGFRNIWICDWSEEAIKEVKKAIPEIPEDHLLCQDFFDLQLKVDLILEQTFFCALSPNLRNKYCKKTANLLHNQGILVGLLFSIEFDFDGPPFGGKKETYSQLFSPQFIIEKMELCYNSISPRKNNELFIKLRKR